MFCYFFSLKYHFLSSILSWVPPPEKFKKKRKKKACRFWAPPPPLPIPGHAPGSYMNDQLVIHLNYNNIYIYIYKYIYIYIYKL